MKLSANQAHKMAHVSKKTLLKHLENGTLTGSKNDKGHWQIEVSELLRVFPETSAKNTSSQPETPLENNKNTPENNVLQVELDAVRAQLETANLNSERERDSLNDQIEYLRRALDKSQSNLELITHQNAPEKSGVIGRIFGKRKA